MPVPCPDFAFGLAAAGAASETTSWMEGPIRSSARAEARGPAVALRPHVMQLKTSSQILSGVFTDEVRRTGKTFYRRDTSLCDDRLVSISDMIGEFLLR